MLERGVRDGPRAKGSESRCHLVTSGYREPTPGLEPPESEQPPAGDDADFVV
jgi:hypothetical protein